VSQTAPHDCRTLQDDAVTVRSTEDGTVVASLGVPATANAMSDTLAKGIRDAVQRAVDIGARAIVITSTGHAFCAGVDLADVDTLTDAQACARFRGIQATFDLMRQAPLVTIAVVKGPAVGAGADLALACDHRLGTVAASFRFPGPAFGLLLGASTLAETVGPAVAQRLLLSGDTVLADEARALGLLTGLHDPDEVEPAALNLAARAARAVVDVPALVAATRRRSTSSSTLLEQSMTPGLSDRMRRFAHARRKDAQ
jgi:enoyl-CoA hydratase